LQKRRRLLLAATLLLTAWSGCSAPAKPREVMSIATSTLADLTAGAVTEACSRIYEPGDWDPARVAQDHRELADLVGTVMNEVGTISGARMIHKWTIYELQLTGADEHYWLALPNLGIATRVTYAVNFSKIGPGVLSFAFTDLSGKWELRSISFGVAVSAPNAQETALRIGRLILAKMAPGMSGQQLDQAAARTLSQQRN
jgi:hypothetical protein